MPSQKSGMERPRKATKVTEVSHPLLRRVAAIRPAGTAMATASRKERKASDRVRGKASASNWETGTRLP